MNFSSSQSAQCNQNPAGGLSSSTSSHSSVLSTLLLYLKDPFIPRGKVDYTIPSGLSSLRLHIIWLFKIIPFYLSGLSLADWQMGSLPAPEMNWFLSPYFDFISILQVTFGFAHLCSFTECVRKQLFILSKCDWELNSGLQNSTCKLESLTLKKKPRNNKNSPKTQAQDSKRKYSLIFIINAALCVLYFTLTQPDL